MNRNYGAHARYVPPGRIERSAVWVAAELGSWGPRLVATYHRLPPPRTVLSYPFTKLIGTLASVLLVLTLVGFLTPMQETAVRAQRPVPGDPAPPLVETTPTQPGQVLSRPATEGLAALDPVLDVVWEKPTIEATQALAPVKVEKKHSSAPRTVYNWKVPARHDLPRPGHPVQHPRPRPGTELPHPGEGQPSDHAGSHDPRKLLDRLLREARERAGQDHHDSDRDRDGGGRHSRPERAVESEGRHSGSVARHADRDSVRSGDASSDR